jgi:hypothetical protein
MQEQQYLEERLEHQIKWYASKSRKNKKWHLGLRLTTILLSTSLPFLTNYLSEFTQIKYIIAFIGVAIAIIEGLQSLYKFNDNWILYRRITENLRKEKIFYLTKSGAYKQNGTLQYLVDNAETLMGTENTTWYNFNKTFVTTPPNPVQDSSLDSRMT